MRRKLLFALLFRFVVSHDDDSKILLKIVKAVSEVHFFSFYVIFDSNQHMAHNHLYTELIKSKNLGFSTVIQIPLEKYGDYSYYEMSNKRTRCLKIVNGKMKKDRDLFVEVRFLFR